MSRSVSPSVWSWNASGPPSSASAWHLQLLIGQQVIDQWIARSRTSGGCYFDAVTPNVPFDQWLTKIGMVEPANDRPSDATAVAGVVNTIAFRNQRARRECRGWGVGRG